MRGKMERQLIEEIEPLRWEVARLNKKEAEHKELEELFAAFANSSQIGVYIAQNRKFVFVNRKFQEYTGFSQEELLGMDTLSIVHPEDRNLVKENAVKMLKGERFSPYEFRTVSKDGRTGWVMETVTSIYYAGKPATIGSLMDITEHKKAEEEIRQLKAFNEQMVEQAPIGILRTDEEGRILYENPKFSEIMSVVPEGKSAAIGQKLMEMPNVIEAVKTAGLENFEDLGFEDFISRISRKGLGLTLSFTSIYGKESQLFVKGVPLFASNSKFNGALILIEDSTARKKAEEAEKALQEREQYFRALIENSSDVIHVLDSEGVIRYVSPSIERVLGYKPEELTGRLSIDMVHPDDIPEIAKVFKEALQKPRVPVITTYRCKHKDGTWRVIECTGINYLDYPTVNGFISNMHDITERNQYETRIKQAAEEWRTTFDSIADLVSIHDKDFRLLRVNKAFADAFKMKPKELIGKTCYEVVHGTKEPVPGCPYKKILETKKLTTTDFFEPHIGIHLEVSASPTFNEKGEVVSCVHIARDITERKEMEQQLIVADRLASIGEMASGIAHELNNPLTSIIGFSQLVLDANIPDDVKEDISIIHSEANRTALIVKNLLTFARKHEPVKQLTNINSIIKGVLELRGYEQRVNNIQVNTQLDPKLPEIMVDYFQMQQVFLNIVINAEDAMREAHNGGTLTITTQKVNDIIKASFADDGPGIAQENLTRIFNPFFTTKEVGKGTGLGLSICYGIVTQHGGRIYARSKLGEGATFVVELPVDSH